MTRVGKFYHLTFYHFYHFYQILSLDISLFPINFKARAKKNEPAHALV